MRPIRRRKLPRKVYLHSKADYGRIKDGLVSLADEFKDRTETLNVEDTWNTFLEAFNKTID
jgi:hypothetical protein